MKVHEMFPGELRLSRWQRIKSEIQYALLPSTSSNLGFKREREVIIVEKESNTQVHADSAELMRGVNDN